MSDEQTKEATRILAEAGISLSIGGCGCCGSPWVRLTHNGVDIVYETNKDGEPTDRDCFSLNMHSEARD